MSNRISIRPIHGMQGGAETPCPACGIRYCLADFVEATDHAVGKKYLFGIVNCKCGRVLNKAYLRKILPYMVYNEVFPEDDRINN